MSFDSLDALLQGHDDRAALVMHDRSISRAELRRASIDAADALTGLGFRRGDALALWLPNGPAWLQLLFAAARLGVLIVPISTRYKPPEVRHLLAVSQARGIVCASRFLDVDYARMARDLQPDLPGLQHLLVLDEPEGFLRLAPGAGAVPDSARTQGQGADLLCCFSTSGTTGSPKLAAHDHAGSVRHVRMAARALDIRPGDAVLCALPLFGVFGFVTALSALAGAACCVMQPVYEAAAAAQAIGRHGITHVCGADAMFDAMLQIEGANFSTWRRGVQADFVGLPLQVTRRGDAFGIRFSGTYGSSECFALMSFHPWEASAEVRARSGGILIDEHIQVRVVDPQSGNCLGQGEVGELQFKGPNVLTRYLNNPQASAAAFTDDGWYRSGDLGQLDGPGFLYLARMGDSLRLRGFLVNPAEIESCLMQHPQVSGAQVVGVMRPGAGEVAVAYVLLTQVGVTESELLEHCRDRMAAYKVPLRIIAIDEFPAINGPNGNKIQKRVLRDMAKDLLGQPDEPAPLS